MRYPFRDLPSYPYAMSAVSTTVVLRALPESITRGFTAVRTPQVDVKAIDALFGELDDDGSGELDLPELALALRKLVRHQAKASNHVLLVSRHSATFESHV